MQQKMTMVNKSDCHSKIVTVDGYGVNMSVSSMDINIPNDYGMHACSIKTARTSLSEVEEHAVYS